MAIFGEGSKEPNLAGGGSMADVRSKFSVDTSQMEKLVKGFSSIKADIKWMHDNLDKTIAKVNKLANALGTVSTANTSPSTSTSTASAVSNAVVKSQDMVSGSGGAPASTAAMGVSPAAASGFFKNFRGSMPTGTSAAGGGGAMSGLMGKAGGLMGGGNPLSSLGSGLGSQLIGALGMPIAMIDKRADAGYAPALAADRMGMLYQQTQGITNNQYAKQFRAPLAGGLLGAGGINTLLGLQAQTGLQSKVMMPGVEALRVASGFSYTTQDITKMISTLASPVINNRMTMTMGTGIYGIGGKQRNPMEVTQQIVRSAGLTNERMVNSGMQQGSVTRARLTSMGVPEDMQDIVLQYAQENIQFQKKSGGKQGMYDPSNASQRKTMGINKNFAMEAEVTDVRRNQRDEMFYRRQADNYAALERNTQKLISAFTMLEDKLSGIIGARISSRNNPLMKIGKNLLGLGLIGGGAAFTALTGGAGGVLGGGIAVGAGTKLLGDGTANKSDSKSPTVSGSSSKGKFAQLEKRDTFSKLNPKFKERLLKMMADNPNVGIGNGYRSSTEQRSMFLSRYSRTTEDTGTYWNGSFWKKHSGADAAPPGMSMHEIGLAADLTGDLDWVQKNAAKYGLQTFANVNDEPWHVQPAELPRGRSEYEKKNSPWGTIAGGSQYDPESKFNGSPDMQGHRSSSATGVAKQSVESYGQMSIAESIAASKQANQDLLGTQGGGMGRTKSVSSVAISSNTKASDSGYSSQKVPSSGMTTRNHKTWGSYQIPKRRFTRADWDAIAQVETKKNWKFVNDSKMFRGGLAMNSKVWDFFGGREFARWAERATPEEQIKIAERSSFDGYNDPKTGKFKPASGIGGFESVAKNAIKWPNTKTGDGAPTSTPVRSGGSVRIEGGSNITIAPTIYIQSAGNNSADAQRAAKEVSNMMVREIKIAAMRSM
jgi:hypothetical protein